MGQMTSVSGTYVPFSQGVVIFLPICEHHCITCFRQNASCHLIDQGIMFMCAEPPVSVIIGQSPGNQLVGILPVPPTKPGMVYPTPGSNVKLRASVSVQLVFISIEDDVELWDVDQNISDKTSEIKRFFRRIFVSSHRDRQPEPTNGFMPVVMYLDGIIEYDFFYEPWTFHYMTSSLAPKF